jgi:hypothetical protein
MGRTQALHHRCCHIGKGLSSRMNAAHVYPENELRRTSETTLAAARSFAAENESFEGAYASFDANCLT